MGTILVPGGKVTQINAVFARICELGIELGWHDLKSQPGCAEHQVDEHWWFAINPHGERVPSSHHQGGASVPAYCIYIEYDGFPYAIVEPSGAMRGPMTMGGMIDDQLLNAVDGAIEKMKTERVLVPKNNKPG